jgi:hypothetical protein
VTARVSRDHLYIADELFVCGTAAEIVGIAEVDGRRVGPGRTGAITTRLQQAYADAVHGRHAHSAGWLEYVGSKVEKSISRKVGKSESREAGQRMHDFFDSSDLFDFLDFLDSVYCTRR